MQHHSQSPGCAQEEFNRVLYIALAKSESLLIICPGFKDSLDKFLPGFFGELWKVLKKTNALEFPVGGTVKKIYLEYGKQNIAFKSGNAFLPWLSPVATYEAIHDERVLNTFFIPASGKEAVAYGGKDELASYLKNFPKSLVI